MQNKQLRILHLEDLPADAELVDRQLKKGNINYTSLVVSNRADYIKGLNEFEPDIILSDHSLPSFDSGDALRILKASGKNIPFVLVTATISEEYAVEVMREGANDYVLKDRLQRLPNAVLNAMEKWHIERERQKYLDEVVSNEALLKEAEHLAGFGSWQTDLMKGSSKWSNESYRILGLQPGEIEPSFENFLSHIHPEDRDFMMKTLEDAIQNKVSGHVTFRVIDKNGVVKYMRSEIVAERNEKNQTVRVTGINQDVTDIKRAERELQENVNQLKSAGERQNAILNTLPANIALLDERGNIVSVNEAWKKFATKNGSTMPNFGIGYNYIEVSKNAGGVDEVDGLRIAEGIQSVIGKKIDQFTMEYPCHAPAERRWFRVTVNPLSESANKGVVVMHINITERMLSQLEKDKITDDLIQRNRDLEQFAYIVSHNLRAPVANILGITEMMNTFSLTVSEEDEMKSELIVSVKKLDGVIKDLNHILQVKREVNEKREVVYLADILDDIKLSIRSLMTKEKVEIRSNFNRATNMVSLKSYVYSIFYNLIVNSIKYKQLDRPPVIRVESFVRNGKMVLEFEDNGIGIDLAKKGDQVFGLYKRFHLHQEGKGMGLYMVKTQVETLGGKISIESEVNKGTKFTIEFEQ